MEVKQVVEIIGDLREKIVKYKVKFSDDSVEWMRQEDPRLPYSLIKEYNDLQNYPMVIKRINYNIDNYASTICIHLVIARIPH